MVYNPSLAQRIREILLKRTPIQEKKMFGGIAFMLNGNMALGVLRDDLIARIGLEKYENALRQPGIELFTPTGKPMAGWIRVTPQAYRTSKDLMKWIDMALDFTQALPAK
jgi:TfoX/Sxy family transcriptional regulator of competence genes